VRVLVTGGAGYIGSHAVLVFLSAGYDVLVYDNYATSSPEALRRVMSLTGRDVRVIERDIRDRDALLAALQSWPADAVVHFAGLKSVAESVTDPVRYFDVNVGGAVSLLSAMDGAGCRNIVFSSSATVYGAPEYLPYDEDHPLNPVNPYGRSKLAVEGLLSDWANADGGRAATSLRYFNPVGAHPSGQIGEDPKGVPNNLMPYIAQTAVGRRPRVATFGDDYETRDGTGERDYIHVMDLAEAHLAALQNLAPGAGMRPYNIGTGKGVTVLELVRAFEVATGAQVPTEITARRAGDLPRFYADATKAKAELGWLAVRDLHDMCLDAWGWQSENPRGYDAPDSAATDAA
jgi:UDP-glucose 4-epimerase